MALRWLLRGIGVLLAFVCAGPGALAAPAAAPVAEYPTFRHGGGEGEHAQPACTACHRLDAAGEARGPGIGSQHDACTGCHSKAWRGPVGTFCWTCHTGTPSRGRWPVAFPPFRARGESDFVLARFDHARHQQAQPDCAACHPAKPAQAGIDRSRPGHAACLTCHGPGQSAPAMTACAGCHAPAPKDVAPLATRAWTPYRVNLGFDHASHEGLWRGCQDCHANAAVPAGQVVPLPRKVDCEGCHDGAVAFAVTATRCRACHVHGEGTP